MCYIFFLLFLYSLYFSFSRQLLLCSSSCLVFLISFFSERRCLWIRRKKCPIANHLSSPCFYTMSVEILYLLYSRRCAATSFSLSCSYFVPFVRSSSFSSTNSRKWIDPFVHGQCAPSYTRTKPLSLTELGKISIDHSFLYHFLLWPCIFRGLQGFPLFLFISHSTSCSSRGSVFDGSSATSTRRFEIDLLKWNVTRELAGRASRRRTYASHQPRNCLTTMR